MTKTHKTPTDAQLALAARRAEARVRIAAATGRDPFAPAVIREAHRQVAAERRAERA